MRGRVRIVTLKLRGLHPAQNLARSLRLVATAVAMARRAVVKAVARVATKVAVAAAMVASLVEVARSRSPPRKSRPSGSSWVRLNASALGALRQRGPGYAAWATDVA